jgi:hypothetical protein
LLKEDRTRALADEDGGLGPAELVVQRSLSSLSTDQPKQLFQLLSACPEDANIPVGIAVLIWSASNQAVISKNSSLLAAKVIPILHVV